MKTRCSVFLSLAAFRLLPPAIRAKAARSRAYINGIYIDDKSRLVNWSEAVKIHQGERTNENHVFWKVNYIFNRLDQLFSVHVG